MQLGQAQVVRSDWIDRSPAILIKDYTNYVDFAAAQTRWTYTVPANRKLKVTALSIVIVKDSGALLSSMVYAQIHVTPNGGASQPILTAAMQDTALGVRDSAHIGEGPLLHAGDVIEFITHGASAPNTPGMWTSGLMIGTLYDA